MSNVREARAEGFLSTDECQEFARLLDQKYAPYVNDRHFETVASKDDNGVYITITLRNAKGSFVYPVEGRIHHDHHTMSYRDAAVFLIDYIDMYFGEYFKENGEVYLPIDWADFESDDVRLQLRGQIRNIALEELADQWLASTPAAADDNIH